jgi:RNA polymerase sigma-70 factor (ECF subfamily)
LTLEQLSPEQREALVLFEVHGLSIREVSEVLGKKEGAVRVLLHRARERLEELLRKAGINPAESR